MLTQEEIAERVNYIGASDAAAALGLSRFKSVLTLWAEKTGQLTPEDISNKTSVKLGNKMEDMVAELFTERTGLQVERIPMVTHPQYNFIRARPDRKVVGENWGVECKYIGVRKAKELEGEEIPQEFLIQCHHQNMVCGFDGTYLAYIIGNETDDFKIVERDENINRQILFGERNLWENYIVPRIMPMTIGANDAETLLALFPNSEPLQSVELNDEANRIIEFRNAAVQDKYSLETQIKAYDNQIKALLGNAEKGESQAFKVVWKSQSRRGIDVELLKEQNPRIYNQYLRVTNSRKLNIMSKVIGQGVTENESE